jgi:Protein of unknown function (DUF2510)
VSAPEHPVVAPPGWYPDPDGTPGMVRWWNGSGWSDVATPAGPGLAVRAVGPTPHLPADRLPTDRLPPPDPATSASSRRRTPWLVAAALALVAGLVAVVALTAGGDDEPVAAPPSFPSSGTASPSPGGVRIVDEAAGISYAHLDGWQEYDLDPKIETLTTAGQYFVTQADPPSGGIYLAECSSGPLADGFGWRGPASLRPTAAAVAAVERVRYYPQPNEERVLRDEAVEVDGHEAWLYEFHLSWDTDGYDATGERAAVLLVDTGADRPALLFLSIPNTHAELYGVIDRVVASVEVL